jgi:hypothetical protein
MAWSPADAGDQVILSGFVRKFGDVLVAFQLPLFYVIPEDLIGNMVFSMNGRFHFTDINANHIPDGGPSIKSFEGMIRGLPPHESSGG